jgi:hypothetical protein
VGIEQENAQRWREAMERFGVDTVRAKLAQSGAGKGADVGHIVSKPPNPSRAFVEEWLAERDKAAHKYRIRIDILALILGAIGAVAGVAALALTVWWH